MQSVFVGVDAELSQLAEAHGLLAHESLDGAIGTLVLYGSLDVQQTEHLLKAGIEVYVVMDRVVNPYREIQYLSEQGAKLIAAEHVLGDDGLATILGYAQKSESDEKLACAVSSR